MPTPPSIFTYQLSPDQGRALRDWLRAHHAEFRDVAHARFAASKDRAQVVLYESGKLVVQGRGARDFVEFVLEPEILREARLGYETVVNPDLDLPRLGVDESGKGDFFGPLCIAGVYVNAAVVRAWRDAGIRDSKSISSDRRVSELARCIRETPGCVYAVVAIGNEAYNRLHQSLGSVNRLLAWGHARVIENLMLQRHRMNPPPERAISDQFAHDPRTVGRALMALGREIELVQRPRAESDLAVAAASILARDEFVTRLRRLEQQFGVSLPKGASAAVEDAAREFIARHGVEKLPTVAKMHFRTAARVQGLPEPPRAEWRPAPVRRPQDGDLKP